MYARSVTGCAATTVAEGPRSAGDELERDAHLDRSLGDVLGHRREGRSAVERRHRRVIEHLRAGTLLDDARNKLAVGADLEANHDGAGQPRARVHLRSLDRFRQRAEIGAALRGVAALLGLPGALLDER